jgi:hypothetical protein
MSLYAHLSFEERGLTESLRQARRWRKASVWAVEVEDFTDDLLHPLPMLRAERRFLLSLRHATLQQQPT